MMCVERCEYLQANKNKQKVVVSDLTHLLATLS